LARCESSHGRKIQDALSGEDRNKQLNFLQQIFTILKQHGRAAIVVPRNILFGGGEDLRTDKRSFLAACRTCSYRGCGD